MSSEISDLMVCWRGWSPFQFMFLSPSSEQESQSQSVSSAVGWPSRALDPIPDPCILLLSLLPLRRGGPARACSHMLTRTHSHSHMPTQAHSHSASSASAVPQEGLPLAGPPPSVCVLCSRAACWCCGRWSPARGCCCSQACVGKGLTAPGPGGEAAGQDSRMETAG